MIVVLAVGAFLVRGLNRSLYPVLYAEDGAEFFAGSHEQGVAALWRPFAGYLHVFPRIIALALSPLPFDLAPAAYVLAAIAAYLAVASLVLSKRVWLLPSPVARASTFALLCVAPTLAEAYGNIANLIFVGGFGLVLIALSDDPRSPGGRVLEVVAVLVLGLSGPVVVMFVPLLAYRWWRSGRSAQSLAVAAAGATAALVQIVVYLNSPRTTDGGWTVGIFVRSFSERIGGVWIFGTADVFGPQTSGVPAVVAAVWIVAVFVATMFALRGVAAACWATIALLLAVVTTAYGELFVSGPVVLGRHLVVPVAIIVVLLVATLAAPAPRWTRVVCALALLAGAWAVVVMFLPKGYTDPSDMTGLQTCWEAGLPSCSTDIYPPGWTAVLTR